MPEFSKEVVIEKPEEDFSDELTEILEEEKEEDVTLSQGEGFFARLGERMKDFFKTIRDKVSAVFKNVANDVSVRANVARNKAILGKANYEQAVAKEYKEAHEKGEVDLIEGSHQSPQKENHSVEELMKGESAFDKVNKPLDLSNEDLIEDVAYDVTVTKVIPDKNLLIVNASGKEGRIHSSQLPKDKSISDFKEGDVIEAAYIGQYSGNESFSVSRLEQMMAEAEKQAIEDSKDNIDSPDFDPTVFGPDLTDEEFNAIFYDDEQKVVSDKLSEIPIEALGDSLAPSEEPVSPTDSPKNHICYDVNSFIEATSKNAEQTVTLIGGKGSIELTGVCDGKEWTFTNASGKKVSDEKAATILTQHKNIGDVEKAISAHLLAQKETFDKFKETSDRAESAFEPTVFHYQHKAVLVTHEGKAVEVAPMNHSEDTVRQTFNFNKRGIDSAAKTVKNEFSKASLDKGDDLIEEEKRDNYVDIDAAISGYDDQKETDSLDIANDTRNNNDITDEDINR